MKTARPRWTGWASLAVVARLSPLLIVGLIYAVMKMVYVVTGGTFPGLEWL